MSRRYSDETFRTARTFEKLHFSNLSPLCWCGSRRSLRSRMVKAISLKQYYISSHTNATAENYSPFWIWLDFFALVVAVLVARRSSPMTMTRLTAFQILPLSVPLTRYTQAHNPCTHTHALCEYCRVVSATALARRLRSHFVDVHNAHTLTVHITRTHNACSLRHIPYSVHVERKSTVGTGLTNKTKMSKVCVFSWFHRIFVMLSKQKAITIS